ncbi:hypothetical protein M409DRAFT_69847 [Zasmidium cellare ATCC 36951]|uniref:NAD(P)-binding protein n=1 Tax=Zasmidium cellare ATCC 36951 TaxID=1080233 RepID=A0A6A6C770_ZASCE|nr:uncharacterized protein M409DRAFT_69847 [Zasmidium cellare ATCC 36951]KAF2161216.1 hypothetical protein M409DRAFT_69847 [Zasmidium cellare ATCC 36951]
MADWKQPYPSFTKTYHHDQYPAIDPKQPALNCSQKIILITGAGAGIGQAIAIAFAQASAKGIALLGRTKATLDETAAKVREASDRTDVFIATADITSQKDVQAAMDGVLGHFDAVPDVLVNNAGGSVGRGLLIDVDLAEFTKCHRLNAIGPLIVSQAFLRANRARTPETPRTIINLPSGAAHLPYAPGGAAYMTSKLASTKITEILHYEHPEWNIFNMQPGVVATELARQAGRRAPDDPRLPAGMAVWLSASPEARELNGRFVWANWDVGELLERKEEIQRGSLLNVWLRGWAEGVSAEELMETAR